VKEIAVLIISWCQAL